MKRDRNHEGYHDPTAGAALRRVRKQKRVEMNWLGLTYTLGELKSFREKFCHDE